MRLLVVLLFLLTTPTISEASVVPESQLDSLMSVRIEALEQRWRIHFDPALRPIIRTTHPGDSSFTSRHNSAGTYLSDSLLITLLKPDSVTNWPSVDDLDHELIHAYCDQTSRRLGRGPWPNAKLIDDFSPAQAAALRLQNEGIATAATESRENLPGSTWKKCLPMKPEDCFVPGMIGLMYTYHGGRAMIQHIIDHVSFDSTVVYVVSHPVDVRGRSFHRSLVRWVEQARRDLKINDPYAK